MSVYITLMLKVDEEHVEPWVEVGTRDSGGFSERSGTTSLEDHRAANSIHARVLDFAAALKR